METKTQEAPPAEAVVEKPSESPVSQQAGQAKSPESDGSARSQESANPEPTIDFQGSSVTKGDAAMLKVLYQQQGKDLPSEIKSFLDAEDGGDQQPAKPETGKSGQDKSSQQDGTAATPPGSSGKAKGTTDPQELSRARQALLRWQWSDDLINSLPQEELLSRGLEAAKSQASFDQVANEKKRLQDQVRQILDEQKVVNGKVEEDGKAGKTKEQPKSDDDENPILKILAPLKDDEVYSDVYGPISQAIQEMQRSSTQESKARETRLAELQTANDNLMLEMTRRDLTKDYPQLADNATFEKVRKKCFSLANLAGYHNDEGDPILDRLMKDAIRLELGGQIEQQQQRKLLQRHQSQTEGQPADMSDFSEQKPTGAMTKEQKLLHGYSLLQSGKKPDEVRKILAGISDA